MVACCVWHRSTPLHNDNHDLQLLLANRLLLVDGSSVTSRDPAHMTRLIGGGPGGRWFDADSRCVFGTRRAQLLAVDKWLGS